MTVRIRTFSLAAVCMAAFASAPAAAGDWGLAGSAALTSDYRYRGISQNDRNIAPQGSLNLTGPDGFYAGSWASAINFNDRAGTSVEWDIYAGKHIALDDTTDLNIEPYYYAYPNHDRRVQGFRYSFFELIDTLTNTWGKFTLTGIAAWSPDWFGETGTGWWLYGSAAYAVTDWLSVSGGVGHQWARDLDRTKGIGFPYTEYDVGATATWKQFALDVRYIGTDISAKECGAFNGASNRHWCTPTLVGTLTYNFTLF